MISKGWEIIFKSFIGLISGIIIGFSVALFKYNRTAFTNTLVFQVLFIFLETTITLYLITVTIQEGRKSRQSIALDSRRDRELNHLIKKLEFFSKLVGTISGVADETHLNCYNDFRTLMRGNTIREEYKLWGTPKLIQLFDQWFLLYQDAGNAEVYRNSRSISSDDFIHLMIEQIQNIEKQANDDFEYLLRYHHVLQNTSITISQAKKI